MELDLLLAHPVDPDPCPGIQILQLVSLDIHDPPQLSIHWLIHLDSLFTDKSIGFVDISALPEVVFTDGA
jgi:hypothetical protein